MPLFFRGEPIPFLQGSRPMSKAEDGNTVKIHYTGTLEDGSQFDSSEGREPLEFTIGSGQVIPGFDKACCGMAVGEKVSVTLAPEDAYGEHNPEMVATVERSMMPDDLEPAVGMPINASGPNGEVLNFVITAFDDETVTVDGNAPLAGKALTFAIEMVEVSEGPAAEDNDEQESVITGV